MEAAARPGVLVLASPPLSAEPNSAASAPAAVAASSSNSTQQAQQAQQFFRSGWDRGGYTATAATAPHSSRSSAALGLGVMVPGGSGRRAAPAASASHALDVAHAASEASFWSEAAAATPLSPRSAGTGGAAAAVVSESERSRRRIALRKKSGAQSKRFSGAGSLSGANSPQHSPLAHNNDSTTGSPAAAAAPLSLPYPHLSLNVASSSPPAPSSSPPQLLLPPQRGLVPGSGFGSGRKPQQAPLHDDGPVPVGLGLGGVGGVHRIDVAPDPEADLDVIERVHRSFWARVQGWNGAARTRALRCCAAAHAVAALALLVVCAALLDTAFANPGVHWSVAALALATLGVSELLRRAAPALDIDRMLLWLVCSGVSVFACLLLGILSFHSDALGLDESVRAHWAAMTAEEREQFDGGTGAHYPDLKALCVRNLAALGAACMALVAVQVCLMCLVLAVRTHILSEQAHEYQSLERHNQFQQRLHNRQRMARLSEQMKERRRLRKARGRTPSSSAHAHGASSFTGLGSVAAAAAAASASSSSSSSRVPGVLLEMTSLGGGSGGGSGSLSLAPTPSGSPGPGLGADGDAADRYAAMLSEEVEAELERHEQKREWEKAQMQMQLQAAKAKANATTRA